ncbi:hypothetical protein [Marinobacterium zhoushanense]|nr:hypothetical protein [Marinobacterium zhoushanense]
MVTVVVSPFDESPPSLETVATAVSTLELMVVATSADTTCDTAAFIAAAC